MLTNVPLYITQQNAVLKSFHKAGGTAFRDKL